MRVILIEDDKVTAGFIVKGLKQAGYTVDTADNGETGLIKILDNPCDAAIVDVMLPRLDGISLVEEVRRRKNATPIIFLTAMRSVDDRVKGLQAGGDDYLIKPFAFVELLARLQALIRRSTGVQEATRLTVGDLALDMLKRSAQRGGVTLELQPREFSLLEYLMRNAGKVVSKTMIMEHVWEYNFDPMTNVVEAGICRLRNKLNEGSEKPLIRTIRGVGYILDDH